MRCWLTAYSYWNEGGEANVLSMFGYLAETLWGRGVAADDGTSAGGLGPSAPSSLVAPVVETPPQGCIHPSRPGRVWKDPAAYVQWYDSADGPGGDRATAARLGPGSGAPRVAVLLYRKHVVTEQPYIPGLIEEMEARGVRPIPVFISGVEAHTVVRDQLTSTPRIRATEAAAARVARAAAAADGHHRPSVTSLDLAGVASASPPSLSGAPCVDAVVSTIGFPLVGGPAGAPLEGARQADVTAGVLGALGVPYIVAAPLLLQDVRAWSRDGVGGLQSVVLYGLPELDGAVDAVPLGGLVGDDIFLCRERVGRLCDRLLGWHRLSTKPNAEKTVATLVYGFPPGVGATGTAALLDVPKSLEAFLGRLRDEGYDLGPDFPPVGKPLPEGLGERIVSALRAQIEPRAEMAGPRGIASTQLPEDAADGLLTVCAGVSSVQLKRDLSFPAAWGPTEWGPIPFLPDPDVLVRRTERQWGPLDRYRGLQTSGAGELLVSGVQLGKVWIGCQPALGVEGDPMRLLFERDLTPHPQYAAFYRWLERPSTPPAADDTTSVAGAGSKAPLEPGLGADAVVHLGMHGTVEWLPGAPLGNTRLSWSDALLGGLPNLYVYAANNPSESIVAKRRGYGTLVSHNVPPYGRAGLYKQLSTLRNALGEYRAVETGVGVGGGGVRGGAEEGNEGEGAGRLDDLRAACAAAARSAGLERDVPLPAGDESSWGSSDEGAKAFDAWASRANVYLSELENRLFSSGLHVLGRAPSADQTLSYLEALYGARAPAGALRAAADASVEAAGSFGGGGGGSGGSVAEATDAVARASRSALERAWAADPAPVPAVAPPGGADAVSADQPPQLLPRSPPEDLAQDVGRVCGLLSRNGDELDALTLGLSGGWIPPAPGGDLLRDGAGVLPTGRNVFSLDPYRMPSPSAAAAGKRVATAILRQHAEGVARDAGEPIESIPVDGPDGLPADPRYYPETVAVNLWGLDAIKTRGESVGIVLGLLGARVVTEATGRVARFELIPLEELGRPRVDVLCNMSGIFRDSFSNVVDLLDDCFQRAAGMDDASLGGAAGAALPEPEALNAVRRHALAAAKEGIENPAARLFSNPAGDYGSMVNERVGTSDWSDGSELGDTWTSRNAFSYGRGPAERGAARPEVLSTLLSTTDRVVQQVDSVEYGLTDIQEYYANASTGHSFAHPSVHPAIHNDPSCIDPSRSILPCIIYRSLPLSLHLLLTSSHPSHLPTDGCPRPRRPNRPRPQVRRPRLLRRRPLQRRRGLRRPRRRLRSSQRPRRGPQTRVPLEAAQSKVGRRHVADRKRRRVRNRSAYDGDARLGRHLRILREMGLGSGRRDLRFGRRDARAASQGESAGVGQRRQADARGRWTGPVGSRRRHTREAPGHLRGPRRRVRGCAGTSRGGRSRSVVGRGRGREGARGGWDLPLCRFCQSLPLSVPVPLHRRCRCHHRNLCRCQYPCRSRSHCRRRRRCRHCCLCSASRRGAARGRRPSFKRRLPFSYCLDKRV